jgi:ferric-dicitrate binding protein FerR (iron transport regulator)
MENEETKTDAVELEPSPVNAVPTAPATETPAAIAPAATAKPFEEWAKGKGTDVAMLAAAIAMHGWAQGKEVSEADFDAAVGKASSASMGG